MTQPSASPTSANSIADCGRPVWDMARRDYEAGQTAGAVCAHYGLTESALRSRAHRHDWKRSEPEAPDQSLLDLQSAARSDNDAEPLEFEDMIDQAWNHFERALVAARSVEAARWLKLTEALEARRDRLARKAEDDLILSMLDRFDAIGATNATMKSETRTTSPSPKGDGEDRRSPERQEGASPARPIPTETLQQLHARRRAEAARSTAGAIGATNATAKPADPATPPSGAASPRLSPPFACANGGVSGATHATNATMVSAGILAGGRFRPQRQASPPDPCPQRMCFSTALAALCPGAPVTPPPGCAPEPHRYRPGTGIRWSP